MRGSQNSLDSSIVMQQQSPMISPFSWGLKGDTAGKGEFTFFEDILFKVRKLTIY